MLEKVKLFDRELTNLTEFPEQLPYDSLQAPTTTRTNTVKESLPKQKGKLKSQSTSAASLQQRRVQRMIEPEFTNVKIRDKS